MALISFGCGSRPSTTRRTSHRPEAQRQAGLESSTVRLRNTLRYMVGNVADVPLEGSSDFAAYDATTQYDSLPSLDKWLLGRLNALEVKCYDAYDQYQFQRAVNALSAFATNELSALYFDVAKDRFLSPQHSRGRPVVPECADQLV